jgi:hypothetical protein
MEPDGSAIVAAGPLDLAGVSGKREEASMNIRAVRGALIISGLVAVAAPSNLSLAQSNDTGMSAPRDAGASAPKSATPNTNT